MSKTKDRHSDLAACAFSLFAKDGINQVTLDAIAAEAKVTKGSFYCHYKSKDEVIQAACRHYYEQWYRNAKIIIAPIDNPVERLRQLIQASVKSCLIDEGNRIFTMEIITRSLYDENLNKGWRQFFIGVKAFYVSVVREAVISSLLTIEDPEEAVDQMLTAMEGYKLRAIFEPALCSKDAEERIANQLLLLFGIQPE